MGEFKKTRYHKAVYEEFAEMVRSLDLTVSAEYLAIRLAAIFAADNQRFQPDMFFEACGFGERRANGG